MQLYDPLSLPSFFFFFRLSGSSCTRNCCPHIDCWGDIHIFAGFYLPRSSFKLKERLGV
jgi:hypothetical protein